MTNQLWEYCCLSLVIENRFAFFPQAILSLGYLCSSDIFALINYVGFATWVNILFIFGSKILCLHVYDST